MMKKILSLLSAAVLAFPLFQITVDAAPAEQLPFTLTAPEHVAITYLDGDEVKNGSEWSEIASVGKDAAVKPGDLPAPVIRDLRYTDAQCYSCPVVAFDMDMPDAVVKALNNARAAGGDIWLTIEGRVRDGEWKKLPAEWELKSGEREVPLYGLPEKQDVIPQDTPLELRCCYECTPGTGEEDFRSEYSNVLSFTAQENIQFSTSYNRPSGTDNDCFGPNEPIPGRESEKSMGWLWVLLMIPAIFVLFIILLLVTRSKKQDSNK